MMMKRTVLALTFAVAVAALALPATAEEQVAPPRLKWSFAGPSGNMTRPSFNAAQEIYRKVCSVCHSIVMLAFRNLAEPAARLPPEAAGRWRQSQDPGFDDKGAPIERPGPRRLFPVTVPNELAARRCMVSFADMSTLAKARTYSRGFPWFIFDAFTQYQEQGPDYIAAYLQGFKDAPKGFELPANGHYNEYFPGHNTAMPPPLQAGQVTFDDGAPQTVDQYSRDISAFLMWVAEPHLVQRKRIGFQAMIFLIVLAGLMYFTKKKARHDVEKPHEAAPGQDPKKTTI
jgi:ubiquinol-cytochrome c reductase cytochrome b/c1 subunit